MNQNFFTYAPSAFKNIHIRTNAGVRFEHGRQGIRVGTLKGIATPIDLMMSNIARDKNGFPTHRKIIDAEFTMEGLR